MLLMLSLMEAGAVKRVTTTCSMEGSMETMSESLERVSTTLPWWRGEEEGEGGERMA